MAELSQKEMEGFSIGMALMDCLPVLFFSVTVSVLSLRFYSLLFFVGAFLVIAAGALKCLWKFVLGLARKDIPVLFYQMRVLMPAGFVCMLASLIADRDHLSGAAILRQMTGFPAVICYGAGFLGMICMMIFAVKLDRKNPKHNWIEQGTNALAQLLILLGVIL